ncbi:MAG TPA: SufE family protein [Edaphocola sp.]|nr:SufE family protein [Edaphocola sp.]
MSIKDLQDEIVEEFACYEDWMEKYERIIEIGKEIPVIDTSYKTDDYLIRGCQSQVWLHAEEKDGKVLFSADSDAIITRGLIGLMISVLSGQTAKDIAEADIYFVDKIGLHSHLSPTRSNGLNAMLKQMKTYAIALRVQQSANL